MQEVIQFGNQPKSWLKTYIYFFITAEKPLHDKIRQRQLYCSTRPNKPPAPGTEEQKILKDFCGKVQFLILVFNENEYQAATTRMKSPEKEHFSRAVVFPRNSIVVGMFSNRKTALIYSDEGSNCSTYIEDAIKVFPNAQFAVSIGAGYAFDSEQFKLGDVLVSKQICYLANPRFINGELIDRAGIRVDVVIDLVKVFCMDLSNDGDFEVTKLKRHSKVGKGRIVSLPAIIDCKETRNKICRSIAEVIGGDMEGGELLKFQFKEKIEGVAVIKGVSKYADGQGSEEWEFVASLAALHYAESKLNYFPGNLSKT